MTPLATTVEKLHRLTLQKWMRQARDLGMSHSEYLYLSAVHAQADVPVTDDDSHGQHLHDIVADLGVSKASASAMIVKLEDRGLVARFPCFQDARAQHIVLTKAGQEMLARGQGVYEAVATTARKELDLTGLTE